MKKDWTRMISLISRGARYQLEVGIALVAIIPLLCFCFIALGVLWPGDMHPFWTQILVSVLALVTGLGGYLILRRFPRNIVRLRAYLKDIASGELPEKISLLKSEDDISAIEDYLNMILAEMHHKVKILKDQLTLARKMQKTIEAQANEILDAERHRVMVQSLGAACHHIGQPATILRTYLSLLKKQTASDEIRDKIDKCFKAIEAITDVLDKLRHVSQYRTVPYETFHEEIASRDYDRILDIE